MQSNQFTRSHLAQRDARRDAFHVAGSLELLAQSFPEARAGGLRMCIPQSMGIAIL